MAQKVEHPKSICKLFLWTALSPLKECLLPSSSMHMKLLDLVFYFEFSSITHPILLILINVPPDTQIWKKLKYPNPCILTFLKKTTIKLLGSITKPPFYLWSSRTLFSKDFLNKVTRHVWLAQPMVWLIKFYKDYISYHN